MKLFNKKVNDDVKAWKIGAKKRLWAIRNNVLINVDVPAYKCRFWCDLVTPGDFDANGYDDQQIITVQVTKKAKELIDNTCNGCSENLLHSLCIAADQIFQLAFVAKEKFELDQKRYKQFQKELILLREFIENFEPIGTEGFRPNNDIG